MIRLFLLFFIVFIVSFISLILVYGTISFGMLLLVREMEFFYASFRINSIILGALFQSMVIPGIMFASIVTGMCCIIVYKALQRKQHLRVEHFITIFKSFILFTAFFTVCYYIVTLIIISSGKTGLLMVLPYINVVGDFFDYGLPVMWISVAWYWVSKYESKFINDEEEWMLR